MTGLERLSRTFSLQATDRPAVLPIIHSQLAASCGVKLRDFFTQPEVTADVMAQGARRFGFDGVQLSLGVTTEAEILGAHVSHPPDSAPVLQQYLLQQFSQIATLRKANVLDSARFKMFLHALRSLVARIGDEVFVLATIRGPLLAASQLRSAQTLLMDMLDEPDNVDELLAFTTQLAQTIAEPLIATGAHGLLLGEATCSPSFISPTMYRRQVLPYHKRLVEGLKTMGWPVVGLHICGDTTAIIEDAIAAGVDFLDIDHQVPPAAAIQIARGRIVLRGNLDPSSDFRFASPEHTCTRTEALCRTVRNAPWIMSSGCDIPPGTPDENIHTFVRAVS